jgi:hypothetical protein
MGKAADYGRAALQALLYHFLLYILVVHYFVALKWETTEIEELIPIRIINLPFPEPYQPEGEVVEISNARSLLSYLDTRNNQAAFDASNNATARLETYTEFIKNQWDKPGSIPFYYNLSSLLPEGNKTIKMVSFIKLLKHASLKHIPDKKMINASLDLAYREFFNLETLQTEINWVAIQKQLVPGGTNGGFPAKEKMTQEDIFQKACVVPPLQLEEEEEEEEDDEEERKLSTGEEGTADLVEEEDEEVAIDTSLLLAEDDLETQFTVVQGLLGQRNGDLKEYLSFKLNDTVKAALNDAFLVLNEELQDAKSFVDESLQEFRLSLLEESSPEEQGVEPLTCVAEEDIMILLETGISAMEKRLDIRTALLKALGELDPAAADGLILDADLNTEPPVPDETLIKTINLRRMIDNPILRRFPGGVDALLEIARDYTNSLDPLLAQFCEKLDPGAIEEGMTPGEVLIDYLLRVAGETRIGLPAEVRQKLMESQKGRELLRALF